MKAKQRRLQVKQAEDIRSRGSRTQGARVNRKVARVWSKHGITEHNCIVFTCFNSPEDPLWEKNNRCCAFTTLRDWKRGRYTSCKYISRTRLGIAKKKKEKEVNPNKSFKNGNGVTYFMAGINWRQMPFWCVSIFIMWNVKTSAGSSYASTMSSISVKSRRDAKDLEYPAN